MIIKRQKTAVARTPHNLKEMLQEDSDGFEKRGTLFLEGRITPGKNSKETGILEYNVGVVLSNSNCSFDYGENIIENHDGVNALSPLKPQDTRTIAELRIVEFRETESQTTDRFCMNEWNVQVYLYVLYEEERTSDSEESEKVDITHLPNIKFYRQWERLTYEGDWKATMTNMATNMVLPTRSQETRDRCPLILLHGPAGTGKTTFAQCLAQKLSIRLAKKFLTTKLFEIRTAMLFSKKFGESARLVDEVFVKVRKASEEDREALIIVLIDEVESIAGSRQIGMMQKEAQDGYKATNALLTHLDKLKHCTNVLLICTTNHPSCLDPALLDRCVCQKQINLPKRRAQYEILRSRVQELIHRGEISSQVTFPELAEAKRIYRAKELENPVYRLYRLLETIRTVDIRGGSPTGLSGRYLAGLPSNALDMFQQEKSPELNTAFDFFEQYATLDFGVPYEDEDEDSDSQEEEEGEEEAENEDKQMSPEGSSYRCPKNRGKKRDHSFLVVEGSPEEIGESIRVLKKRGINVVMRIDNVDREYGEGPAV